MTHTAKHTPGPWTARKAPERNAYAWDVEGAQGTVSTIARMALVDRVSEVEGNAHLIAAAPAMYALIKDMRQAFYVDGKRKALLAVMERSHDVVAQAEGRAMSWWWWTRRRI